MKKVDMIVETYADKDFRLDIVTDEYGITSGWIYRVDSGVKLFMYGMEANREIVADLLLDSFADPLYREELNDL